ncbi:MAG: DUF4876 domain-containing protein [Bacteroidales bacterium]|nr:DUF4876 domain-containing protein [Bacteroidales bacterium]
MQNKVITAFAALILVAASCMDLGAPYSAGLFRISITARYPEGYAPRAGAAVSIESVAEGSSYKLLTDASGKASTTLPGGIYRVSVSDRDGSCVFNGTLDKVIVSERDVEVVLPLLYSKAGSLVIKELYCGGCSKVPEEGTYQSDQYLIVHNNDTQAQYLDGLCLGSLSPYNSNSSNPWAAADGTLPDFLPVIQAVWRVGGTGSTFPLMPGEDAVVCLRGAIDHAAQYPMSVNLNMPGYFVCYNPVYFPNPMYHPAPGGNISEDHYLEVVIKTGQANAYTLSINSPALILFRPVDTDIYTYVQDASHVLQVPGSSADRVVAVPFDWVVDGIEVFNGGSSDNRKRLPASVDAGYVTLTETFKGRTLMRNIDEDASAANGFEVLLDTNNSTVDFYERETQSLHP